MNGSEEWRFAMCNGVAVSMPDKHFSFSMSPGFEMEVANLHQQEKEQPEETHVNNPLSI